MKKVLTLTSILFFTLSVQAQPKKVVPTEVPKQLQMVSDTIKIRIYIDIEDSKYLGFKDGYAIRTVPVLNGKPVQDQLQLIAVDKTYIPVKERVKEIQAFDWK